MAAYNPYPQQSAYPTYTTTHHHPASAHPNLYQNSAYSVPALAAPVAPAPTPTLMPLQAEGPKCHQMSSPRRASCRKFSVLLFAALSVLT